MNAGLPRWLAVAFALLAIGAIVTGARETPVAAVVPQAEHFDTAFVRANGFMMDSLRLGRTTPVPLRPAQRPAPRRTPVAPPHDSGTGRDSLPLRYSPRGCMPE